MQEFNGDFDLPNQMAFSAVRAIQSGIELAMVQNIPVTSAHILFGIYSTENTAAHSFLDSRGITAEEILDCIPTYLSDEEPPF